MEPSKADYLYKLTSAVYFKDFMSPFGIMKTFSSKHIHNFQCLSSNGARMRWFKSERRVPLRAELSIYRNWFACALVAMLNKYIVTNYKWL